MVIQERLAAVGNRPSGFDYMRLLLALAVIAVHIPTVVYGYTASSGIWSSWWARPISAIVLPMFFSLSGFLVAGSLFRSKTLLVFLGLRALRIAPALAVETTLSAFILGPIFTTLPLHDYFSDSLFHRYFFNLVGHVQFFLPGVFRSNPWPDVVNYQLWTIPWELRCYIAIAGMSLLGILRSNSTLIVSVVAFYIVAFGYYLITRPITIAVPGMVLVESFLAGVTLFALRDRVRWQLRIFITSFIVAVVLLSVPYGDYLVSFPVAYVTVFLGLLNPPRNRLLLSGDYSYGIYLYAFPIQQAVAAINNFQRAWYYDLIYVLPITFTIAAASWWFVERPTLLLRRYLPTLESLFARPGRRTEMDRKVSAGGRTIGSDRSQPVEVVARVRQRSPKRRV